MRMRATEAGVKERHTSGGRQSRDNFTIYLSPAGVQQVDRDRSVADPQHIQCRGQEYNVQNSVNRAGVRSIMYNNAYTVHRSKV